MLSRYKQTVFLFHQSLPHLPEEHQAPASTENKFHELISSEQVNKDHNTGTEHHWIEGKDVDKSREDIQSTLDDMRRNLCLLINVYISTYVPIVVSIMI